MRGPGVMPLLGVASDPEPPAHFAPTRHVRWPPHRDLLRRPESLLGR